MGVVGKLSNNKGFLGLLRKAHQRKRLTCARKHIEISSKDLVWMILVFWVSQSRGSLSSAIPDLEVVHAKPCRKSHVNPMLMCNTHLSTTLQKYSPTFPRTPLISIFVPHVRTRASKGYRSHGLDVGDMLVPSISRTQFLCILACCAPKYPPCLAPLVESKRTWALDIADNASGLVVHELNSDLSDTSSGSYVPISPTPSTMASTMLRP